MLKYIWSDDIQFSIEISNFYKLLYALFNYGLFTILLLKKSTVILKSPVLFKEMWSQCYVMPPKSRL
jgi:hypothetical protein